MFPQIKSISGLIINQPYKNMVINKIRPNIVVTDDQSLRHNVSTITTMPCVIRYLHLILAQEF